ncbi:Glycosyl transferase family 2 [Chryseolinea serpens]|uniref:Glycosyl transferase family 2 n=1 Tax=Chryseolinea serpens TaxID=947013 RepID=A0A1M5KZJ5_9BACT|nr:glycosyltransferase family 2 protein [Chryseolinea serpens]SHG57583.1 Glycosyl transferase family 2 [Chryseolinea serpens]
MKETLPKISVITPSYNQGLYLEETMLSVLTQEYPNLEYIVIDGGSTDNSVSIIEKYASRLSHWESERDRGFGHAINKGFAKATGDILCWLNSDDILLPGALLTVGTYFKAHPDVGLIYGDRHIIDDASKLIYRRRYFFYLPGQLRYAKTFPQECTFWRRSAFEKVGGNLHEELKYAIDLELWCRLSQVTAIRHIPVFLGAFRDQPQSKSATLLEVGRKERESIIASYYKSYPSAVRLKVYQVWLGTLRRLYRALGLEAGKRNSVLKLRDEISKQEG